MSRNTRQQSQVVAVDVVVDVAGAWPTVITPATATATTTATTVTGYWGS